MSDQYEKKPKSQQYEKKPLPPPNGLPNPPQEEERYGQRPPGSSGSLTFILLLIVGAVVLLMVFNNNTAVSKSIAWGQFLVKLERNEVLTGNVQGSTITGKHVITKDEAGDKSINKLKLREVPSEILDKFREGGEAQEKIPLKIDDPQSPTEYVVADYSAVVPPFAFTETSDLHKQLYEKLGGKFSATSPPDHGSWLMLISIGLTIGLIVFFIVLMRRTRDQIMGGGFPGFTRSPAKRYCASEKSITFDDVAGLEGVKKELVEIVEFLKDPAKFQRMGARVPKGTLLMGPPGTGKTLLGRAVAGEAEVPFYSINGSEFIQMFAGVGASRVRDLFNTAKENAPAILFIDEIDAVGRHRGTGIGAGHDEREQTLNQILSEMDGFTPTESVMVMAATNRPDVLDPALLRPGRFDRHITVDRPTLKGREEIFKVHSKGVPLAPDVDLRRLAKSTVGFTGADIKNLVNEATLWATRNDKTEVEMTDFNFAQDKVIMGIRREEVVSDLEKKKTAYHEAGHTILDWFKPTNSTVRKVSIIPRGRSGGATMMMPEDDQMIVSEEQMYAQLAVLLGGRAAEKMIFSETSAGVEDDLKRATRLARRMVVHWGMSERLGPVAFRTDETHPFLGRDISEAREYSERTAQIIDEEVLRIVKEADAEAVRILTEKRGLLDKLATTLETEEELDEARIIELIGPSPYQKQKKTEEE